MPQIELNGTNIYYESHGEGLPLVFIHDCRTSHRLFEPQVEYFRHRLRVVVWDLRGSGLSGKMKVGIDDILDAQCEDLRALLDKLGIETAILVACSGGGVLARYFASRYKQRTRALVLIDSSALDDAQTTAGKNWLDVFHVCTGSLYYLPSELFLRSLRITYHRWLLAYDILRREVLEKRVTESIKQGLALNHVRLLNEAETLTLPVLFVCGAQDEWTVKRTRKAAARYSSATLVLLEDAIYPSHLCQPYVFNRLLLDFLNDQRMLYESG